MFEWRRIVIVFVDWHAMTTMFGMMTTEGWNAVMWLAVDTTRVHQPQLSKSPIMVFYSMLLVIFICMLFIFDFILIIINLIINPHGLPLLCNLMTKRSRKRRGVSSAG